MAKIEKESTDKNGLRNDVVTLYQGGQYHLYTYKKYTDVRLVFAPEFDIAFFGGDPDNFEYPRYDLDVCFFRAYEDGKPAKVEHYLKWSPDGLEGGRPRLRRRPSRPDRPAQHGRQPRVPPRRRASRFGSTTLQDREAFLLEYGQQRRRGRPASPRKTSSASRTAARRGSAAWRGSRDPSFMRRKAEAETELPRRIKASDSQGRDAPRSRLGQDRRGPEGRRGGSSSPTSSSSAASPSTRSSSRSPATSSAWPRRRPSPTPTGSTSIANRPSSRSSSSCSPRRRSIPSSKRPSWPIRWPTGRSAMPDDPMVERVLHGRSPAGGRRAVRRRDEARRRRSPHASWPKEAGRRSRRPTTR